MNRRNESESFLTGTLLAVCFPIYLDQRHNVCAECDVETDDDTSGASSVERCFLRSLCRPHRSAVPASSAMSACQVYQSPVIVQTVGKSRLL